MRFAAALEPYATLFRLAAVTGARESEIIGVCWKDVGGDIVSIRGQVDRRGNWVEYGKTDTSLRDVPIPAEWTAMLERYRAERALDGYNVAPDAYVFSTRTGRPLDQRNLRRELRRAQTKARTPAGLATFPALQVHGKNGKPVPVPSVPRGTVPDFHAFRHQAASQYIADGWSIHDVADLLGDTVKTVEEVYRQQIDNAKRRRARTDRMAAAFGSVLAA